jgi:biotin carboxylase
MVGAAISVALGEAPDLQPKAAGQAVCIRYFTPQSGRLVGIEHSDLLNVPYVYDASIYRNVGDMVPEARSSSDRSGHVIVVGSTPQAAIEKAESIITKVKIITL